MTAAWVPVERVGIQVWKGIAPALAAAATKRRIHAQVARGPSAARGAGGGPSIDQADPAPRPLGQADEHDSHQEGEVAQPEQGERLGRPRIPVLPGAIRARRKSDERHHLPPDQQEQEVVGEEGERRPRRWRGAPTRGSGRGRDRARGRNPPRRAWSRSRGARRTRRPTRRRRRRGARGGPEAREREAGPATPAGRGRARLRRRARGQGPQDPEQGMGTTERRGSARARRPAAAGTTTGTARASIASLLQSEVRPAAHLAGERGGSSRGRGARGPRKAAGPPPARPRTTAVRSVQE